MIYGDDDFTHRCTYRIIAGRTSPTPSQQQRHVKPLTKLQEQYQMAYTAELNRKQSVFLAQEEARARADEEARLKAASKYTSGSISEEVHEPQAWVRVAEQCIPTLGRS